MKNLFLLLGLVLACSSAVYIISCGPREDDDEVTSEELVRADPSTELESELPPEPMMPDGMVLIPEGEFQMGSNDGDADNDEQPVHTVHLDAFYIDANEVTNGEFKDFVLVNPAWQKDLIDAKFHDGNYLHD